VSIAISVSHRALADTIDAYARRSNLRDLARESLARGDGSPEIPQFWVDFAKLGWLGLHVDERWGGQGHGLAESAVVLERLAMVNAPGPYLPCLIASAILQSLGSDAQREEFLPALTCGTAVAAVSLTSAAQTPRNAFAVYGGTAADFFLLPAGPHDLMIVKRSDRGVSMRFRPGVDPTRGVAIVRVDSGPTRAERVIPNSARIARRLMWSLAVAEAAGGARGCVDMATSYAQVRVQFGRPIGSFQAVKHLCANMFVDAELSAASAWDAIRPAATEDEAVLAAAAASLVAIPAYVRSAERNIQVHGGIGYTWEHNAHLYLRRACALRGFYLLERTAAAEINELTIAGVIREATPDLPASADEHRHAVRKFVADTAVVPPGERRSALVESGYLVPHWPGPWGRDADAVEQLVIDQELPDELRVDMGITGWIALTIAQHASPDQTRRWVRPTLLGELQWCQLFSEPGAGSDAAAVATRGTRVEGGWRVSGQKVWTSGAHESDWGLATVRTDPDARKHAGISLLAINMRAPGVEVRPLRELTGGARFNEVFLNEVFVPDDDLLGFPGGGWRLAMATLGNERMTIGTSKRDERSARHLLRRLRETEVGDAALEREVAVLLAEEYASRALVLRNAARGVEGSTAAFAGSLIKLVVGERTQRTAELGMRLSGELAVSNDDAAIVDLFLFSRCLTIAGGTSEIIRNQIAERILGLPREPLPAA
jgi:alkylation response protein AidB-like acyl-CoA dehydrogenase